MAPKGTEHDAARVRPAGSTIAWTVPYGLLLVLLVIWCALGLVEGELPGKAVCVGAAAAVLVAGAAVTWNRERIAPSRRLNACCIALAGIAAVAALEVSWCAGMLETEPKFLLIELAMALLVICTLYFASQRHGAGVAAGVVIFAVFGIAQYFVRVHKGTAILPSDLLGAATAAAVAGGYVYTLDGTAILGLASAAAGWCAASLVRPVEPLQKRLRAGLPRWRRVVANVLCALACAAVLAVGTTQPDYGTTLGIRVDGWDTAASYERYGLLTSFITAVQDLKITKPAGYSKTAAEADEEELVQDYEDSVDAQADASAQEQFINERPSVICVMNETFSDMSLYDGLGVGYEGPEFFNSIDDALVRGQLSVSAYAGGTCNSEFEFLTGNTLGYLGAGAYPYTLYDLSGCESIVSQMAALGYQTTAIHPNLGTNWNREGIYAKFGFQSFLTIDDFEDAPQFHSGVTDKATYERVLELLESSDDPQFVFDVTMQNHSSYDQANIDESLLRGYTPSYLDEEQTAELNEYLACIDASDADLEWFMGELEKLDRPVVLVFFGDHQASVSAAVNDALFPDEGDQTHGARTYLTNYVVWANYDVEGAGEMRTELASSSTLAALALSACGGPLTNYQEAQLGARLQMPTIDALYYTDQDERIHATGALKTTAGADPGGDAAARARDAYLKLARVQYLNFATHVQ